MFDSFFEEAVRLNREGRPFALATVVRREKPTSGKPGDKAIISPDGSIEGWIGGGCAQPIVIREAKKALAKGKPRFVRIAPSENRSEIQSTDGIVEYPMTCHSGGTLDVYIEPIFPTPHLVIFGSSGVARALSRLGKAIDYRITVIAPEADPEHFDTADEVRTEIELGSDELTDSTYVIVATQGQRDEKALETALGSGAHYVAFVASRRKVAGVFDALRQRGVPEEALERVRVPAGLDIGAKLPEEIAISILAEIVQIMRSSVESTATSETDERGREESDTNPARPTEVLRIGDMSCGHCIATVEEALEGVEGVTVHGVDIGSAEISYDPATVPRERIVDALEEKGYPVLAKA